MEGTQENPTPIIAADCTLPETAASLGTVGGQTDGAGPGHTVRIVSPHMCHADNRSRMGRAITGCFDFFQTLFLKAVSQFSSITLSCLTLHDPIDCSTPASLSTTYSQSLLKFMSIESVMPSNDLILCSPLLLRSVFPQIRIFSMSRFFTTGGQSIGASASASVLPMNIQGRFPFGWTGLISLLSKALSRVFSNNTVQKHRFFSAQLSLESNFHIHT